MDAGVRERLVAAASEHFSQYGYEKTTLADLAKSVGFSKTYFYRFFRSKQEIGEAVCSHCLGQIIAAIESEVESAPTAIEKLRRMLKTIPEMSVQLLYDEERLYDVAAISAAERWASSQAYLMHLEKTLKQIIQAGRDNGEFERKTPLDEVVRAILFAMTPFTDPRVLQMHLRSVPDGSNEVVNLVLRSLAP
ncbi:TetR family transcriptional regulator [Novosphingobium sp. Rr 2-17]|nr:TetR family transcriptional regulator [Novosphingobium sp. Rr 2-17]